MADNYETYSRDELLRLLRERDRKPTFGLISKRQAASNDENWPEAKVQARSSSVSNSA